MNKAVAAIFALGVMSVPSFGYTIGQWAFLDSRVANPNTVTWSQTGNSYDVSPYSGAFGASATEAQDSAAKMFCDDFIGTASYNSSWQATVTQLTDTDLSQTRYGSAVATTGKSGYSYPTGSSLYQEIAWLFTQATASGTNADNQDTIQEAVWKLTGAANSTPNTTYSDANLIGGKNSASGWIELAATYYNKTVTGYLTPNYNSWYVITDAAGAGDATGVGRQEFLAYKTGPGGGAIVAGTPEPATFVLAGAVLVGLGFRRRKTTAVSK